MLTWSCSLLAKTQTSKARENIQPQGRETFSSACSIVRKDAHIEVDVVLFLIGREEYRYFLFILVCLSHCTNFNLCTKISENETETSLRKLGKNIASNDNCRAILTHAPAD